MRILFSGGGTGGHLFPIIAVVRELKRIAEEEQILDVELFYMGPDDFGNEMLRQEEVTSIKIPTGKIRRYNALANFFDPFLTVFAVLRAMWHMFVIMPDVVFSKGGYGALPAVVSAIVFHIPIIIHESDSVPGVVNSFSARFARRIGIAFTGAEKYFPKQKTAMVGVPIRKRILGGNRDLARQNFEISSTLPVIGVLGASQGSQRINSALLGGLKEFTDEFEVLHQTGEKNFETVKGEASVVLEFAHKERYHAVGFMNEQSMREFYAASDFIVSRAGASSIFEIAAWGKPSILVPLKGAAQDHQLENAYEYVSVGATQIVEEGNLTPHILLAEVKKIVTNPDLMRRMSEAAQRFSRVDAAEIISREILKLGLHTGK